MSKPLTLVGIGCGGRTRTYCDLAAKQPHRYQVVAAADPDAERVDLVRASSRNPGFRGFASADACFAAGKLGDVAIIGTQDAYHVEPALKALELGYDLLLEKPVAPDPADVLRIRDTAARLGRRVLVCHVLRYSPFYVKVKELVASGVLGEIVTIDAREGVWDFHQAHSYVRGHWAKTKDCSPMIIAKSCHDLDIISWLVDKPCARVSSFGSLRHFTPANRPAGAPARCTPGCPHPSPPH
jgi:predicted dehydrogenase